MARVAWTLTSRVEEFLAAAGAFLAAAPVDHTALLTESAYLAAHPATDDGRLLAWWVAGGSDGDVVAGALVQAPRHAPLLSRLPDRAVADLVAHLDSPAALGVDAGSVDDVCAVWPSLRPRHRLVVHRHSGAVPEPDADGSARIAGARDQALLHRWFDELMAANPGDPSDRAYVIDDPLEAGGIVLWEVSGQPVAMAGRSPVVADMVRLGPVHAPDGSTAYERAVLHAAVARARRVADHVVVLARQSDVQQSEQLSAAGFVPAAERVLLSRE